MITSDSYKNLLQSYPRIDYVDVLSTVGLSVSVYRIFGYILNSKISSEFSSNIYSYHKKRVRVYWLETEAALLVTLVTNIWLVLRLIRRIISSSKSLV